MSFSQEIIEECEKLRLKVNQPKVVIDNKVCENATVIRINCANRYGLFLKFVQVLGDVNLVITKAKVSSDGYWCMDAFNVTDQDGRKVTDDDVLNYIQECLGSDSGSLSPMRTVEVNSSAECTAIELFGSDRPGLLSELSAVLTNLNCNIVCGELWTHNTRAAAVIHVTDEETGLAIKNQGKVYRIEALFHNILKGSNSSRKVKTFVTHGIVHSERRLHQLMYADRDYDQSENGLLVEQQRPNVDAFNCYERNYTVITIKSKDRPKLIFDTVCTLMDMQYVVYHAGIDVEGPVAYQEYYIRHADGFPMKSDAERQRVIQCLEAAMKRRDSDGLKLELCTTDRVGLLSNTTRIFREYSLNLTRAEVKTRAGKAVNTFYVKDASGNPVDPKTIDTICQRVGQELLRVKSSPEEPKQVSKQSPARFHFGEFLSGLFKSRSIANPRLVRSCSCGSNLAHFSCTYCNRSIS